MNKKLKWRSDFDKSVILDNYVARGWQKCTEKDEDEWNIYWANVWNARNLFNPKSGVRLNEFQVVNHFPNHLELTRKDLMVKNFKRFRKEMEKENNPVANKDE